MYSCDKNYDESSYSDVCNNLKNLSSCEAVFTHSQLEVIISLDLALERKFNNFLLAKQELAKLEKNVSELNDDMKDCQNSLKNVLIYEETNAKILQNIRCATIENTKDIKELEDKVKELECKPCVVNECHDDNDLLCKMEEIKNALKNFITRKEFRDFKDDRVDAILRRLDFLENKKCEDLRVSLLLQELKKTQDDIRALRAVNVEQSKQINKLTCENNKQEEEIECLDSALKRNTLTLSEELHDVERKVDNDNKIDMNQNTDIRYLNSQIVVIKRDIEKLCNTILVKSCDHCN